jgi:hypothetical protein
MRTDVRRACPQCPARRCVPTQGPRLRQAPPAKKAKTAAPAKADASAAQGSCTIFIKNLAWSATEDDLTDFFKDCGAVENVRIGARAGPAAAPALRRPAGGMLH